MLRRRYPIFLQEASLTPTTEETDQATTEEVNQGATVTPAVLDIFVVNDMPNKPWLAHKNFAVSKGGRLATREEVLANKEKFSREGNGAQWIAVEESDGTKDWVHIGSDTDVGLGVIVKFADSYLTKFGSFPSWGDIEGEGTNRAFLAYVVGPRQNKNKGTKKKKIAEGTLEDSPKKNPVVIALIVIMCVMLFIMGGVLLVKIFQ